MAKSKKTIGSSITNPEKTTPLTIEDREWELRAENAKKTFFQIKTLDDKYFPFTDYEVKNENNTRYSVEIRSLNKNINSCNCPDFKVNTLSTCKHIQGVLNFIIKQGKRKFKTFAKNGSNRTEIYLNPRQNEAHVAWPENSEMQLSVRSFLAPYISVSQTQLTDPLMGTASLENALKELDQENTSKIRLSQHLIEWKSEQQLIENLEYDRIQFLDDVKAGKRSLQMLSCSLFPYQEEGMLHLAFQGRAILADEMGLGKTIQAIAACELLRRINRAKKVLVVTPASLKGEWDEQIARFTGLPTLIVTGTKAERMKCYQKEAFFYLVNYEQVRTDYADIQTLLHPDILILDEAQRVKNWQTKTAWSVKQLKTPYAFLLSGTPIENRIDEIYSIMQVIDPKILGPLFKFQLDFYSFDEQGKAKGLKNLNILHQKLQKVVLRRKKKDVEEQLPERTIKNYLVEMGSEQNVRYAAFSDQVTKLLHILKKRPLNPEESKKLQRLLACMRMVADTPYILDDTCRECPKLIELEEILASFSMEKDSKIIIFSEWERMLFLVRELAKKMGFSFAWHTGSVSQEQRREDIKRFKEDPNCRLFLTTDSGSTGLNLQVASVVINLDLPWNPAKLEQRIARAWRKNQSRVVQVINLISENTIEQRMLSTLAMKQAVADAVLDAMNDLSEMPLPSASRQEFIEKLEQLTSMNDTYNISTKTIKANPEHIMEDILARHSDRIHLLEAHQEKMVVVVDKKDPVIQQSLVEATNSSVEVLDYESYMTIKRLAEAGVIEFKDDNKQVLFQSHLIKAEQRIHQQKKLEYATLLYKDAERKLKLVLLLRSGDFVLESLPTAQEVFQKGIETLKAIEQPDDAGMFKLKELQNDHQKSDLFIDALSSWMDKINTTLAQYALGM